MLQDATPGAFAQDVAAVVQAAAQNQTLTPTVAQRLWKRFGGGDKPAARRALYTRLEKLVELHGTRVECLIGEAVMQSTAAKPGNAGRYFCKAINAKLREGGFYQW